MISALILVFSTVMLVQFFFTYTRMLVVSSRNLAVSPQVMELAGAEAESIPGESFGKLMTILELCPKHKSEGKTIYAVRAYYWTISQVASVAKWFAPQLSSSLEKERQGCAYFAALLLDQRLTLGREAIAQQAFGKA